MELLGTRMLETERLCLRKIKISDYNEMYKNWASIEACSEYFPWPSATEIQVYYKKVATWVGNYKDGAYFNWVIEWKTTKELIGIVNLHNVDKECQSAETSYILSPPYWGKGIMSEALKRVLQFAFEDVKLNRVEADVFQGNKASEHVLQKCGFQKEGTTIEEYYKNGTYIDSVQYAIDRSAWK